MKRAPVDTLTPYDFCSGPRALSNRPIDAKAKFRHTAERRGCHRASTTPPSNTRRSAPLCYEAPEPPRLSGALRHVIINFDAAAANDEHRQGPVDGGDEGEVREVTRASRRGARRILERYHAAADRGDSKSKSLYFDPCQEAASRSIKCLNRNKGDRDMCGEYFQYVGLACTPHSASRPYIRS